MVPGTVPFKVNGWFKVNEQCETSVEYELGDILHLDSPALQRLHQVTNFFFCILKPLSDWPLNFVQ
jgi:hypothetical protein